MESDPNFLLRRAKEESLRALETDQPEAAQVHQKLAVHYLAKAAIGIVSKCTPVFLFGSAANSTLQIPALFLFSAG